MNDGTKMYRFATIEKQLTSPLKPKYTYNLYTSEDKKGELMLTLKRTTSNFFTPFRGANIRDKNEKLVAKVGNDAFLSVMTSGQADKYKLKVGKGNDVLACAILSIVADTVSDRTPLSIVKQAIGQN